MVSTELLSGPVPGQRQVRTRVLSPLAQTQADRGTEGNLKEADRQQRHNLPATALDLNPQPPAAPQHPQDVRLLLRLAKDLYHHGIRTLRLTV